MAVKFNVSNARLNATIELTDITEEQYRDIVTYITLRTEEKTEELKQEPVSSTSKPMTVTDTESKTDGKLNHGGKYTRHPEVAKMLDSYFEEAKKAPNDYETVLMTARDFISRFPEYEEFGQMAVSKRLQCRCVQGERVYEKDKKGHGNLFATFYIPIRKSNTIGDAIRKGRKENGLSTKELAELIEYPVDVVKKWENGEYTPSSDGLAAMKLVLGEHCFESSN